MKKIRSSHLLAAGLLVAAGALGGLAVAELGRVPPQTRDITISAKKYAYDPPVLRVNRGDRLRLTLVATDVTHGFYFEGYDLDARARPHNPTFWVRRPSQTKPGVEGKYDEVEHVEIVASRTGKFRYRCSVSCGYMHAFMQGELIVGPNYLYSASVGASLGLAAGLLLLFFRTELR